MSLWQGHSIEVTGERAVPWSGGVKSYQTERKLSNRDLPSDGNHELWKLRRGGKRNVLGSALVSGTRQAHLTIRSAHDTNTRTHQHTGPVTHRRRPRYDSSPCSQPVGGGHRSPVAMGTARQVTGELLTFWSRRGTGVKCNVDPCLGDSDDLVRGPLTMGYVTTVSGSIGLALTRGPYICMSAHLAGRALRSEV
ncbi:hypothetical protein DPEC_G00253920 [Dallia pectoralis]|uniref:Uncharacterized protein n=1 Tax=Dallia pectoralis TaxID=75939 RepID=A0ACC2FTX3_DALPE|nr:hypothetical protein DPEC_G00253920 [Dallia pectoralis]